MKISITGTNGYLGKISKINNILIMNKYGGK